MVDTDAVRHPNPDGLAGIREHKSYSRDSAEAGPGMSAGKDGGAVKAADRGRKTISPRAGIPCW